MNKTPTIRSKVEVIVAKDIRSNVITTSGFVEIEIASILHDLKNGNRILRVEDFLITTTPDFLDEELNETFPGQTLRKRITQSNGKIFKEITKTKEEFEALEQFFETNYPEATFNEMVTFALLSETQTNPIYNTMESRLTTADDWEIKQTEI